MSKFIIEYISWLTRSAGLNYKYVFFFGIGEGYSPQSL